jgi:Protein of unknown function (DUF3618)
MDETPNEIEAQIDKTRERLGSNLRELEDKVDAATDWRELFRERPQLFLGAAFIGGVVLASALKPKSAGRPLSAVAVNPAIGGNGSVQAQARELLNNIQAALVGVATARIKEYIGESVPGFDEHYRRAEQRAAAVDPTTTSIGRTTG